MESAGLTGHMMVKNEEFWIWYAIHSVLPFLDKLIIFDTGSTDKTVKIIHSIKSKKIQFQEKGTQDRQGLVGLRNEMVRNTQSEWFLLIDGDEVWPESAIKTLISQVNKVSDDIWGIVVRTRNCVGDIYHYQPESAGQYEFLGKKGHLTVRTYRKLPEYTWKGEYPLEGYSDNLGNPIHEQDDHLVFLDVAYWHLTHLTRSSKPSDVIDRDKKHKLEIGIKAKQQELPEIFFAKVPAGIASPLKGRAVFNIITSALVTPIRLLKRRLTYDEQD